MIEGHLGLRGVTVCGFLFAVWAAMFWCWDPLRIFPAFLFHHDQKKEEEGGDLFFFSFFLLFITHRVQIIVPVSCILLCMAWRWQIWGIRLHIPIKQPQKVYCQSSCKSQDLSQRPGNEALACRQRRVWGRAYERKNDRDEVLMGRYGAAAEVSYADRKKRACLLWDSGEESICCPSGWLSFFQQSSSVSFLSHTHSLPRPCSLFIYLFILQFPLSLPHCPRSISAPLFHFVAALNSPHQNTHSSIAHRSYHQMKYLPPPYFPKIYSFHMGTPTGLCTL